MWRVNVSKSIKEIRFVVKQDVSHHGVWWEIPKSWRISITFNLTCCLWEIDPYQRCLDYLCFRESDLVPFLNIDCRNFVKNELPLLKVLNPNTHFITAELHPKMQTDSSVQFLFGDSKWKPFSGDLSSSLFITDSVFCEFTFSEYFMRRAKWTKILMMSAWFTFIAI